MPPPLALDIDGTLTTPEGPVDPRIFDALPAWDAPVVLATGKAFPFPVALCHFLGLPETVVAENGGVVYADREVTVVGDPDGPRAVVSEFRARGGDPGWELSDTINRWRETEVAVGLDADEELLRDVAAEHGMEVLDTGYAYHVKAPGVAKGDGLRAVADALGTDPGSFVAVGDSENDASLFSVAARSFAVANADPVAREAADEVTDGAYFDGALEALAAVE